ncbi:MAG: hypothetical protein ABI665_16260, partial [Vicinamibacterales bacterium]
MKLSRREWNAMVVGGLVAGPLVHRPAAAEAAALQPGSSQAAAAAWRPLFDGKSLNGWRGYKTETIPAG